MHGSTELTGDLDLLWDGTPDEAHALRDALALCGCTELPDLDRSQVGYRVTDAGGDLCTPALPWGAMDVTPCLTSAATDRHRDLRTRPGRTSSQGRRSHDTRATAAHQSPIRPADVTALRTVRPTHAGALQPRRPLLPLPLPQRVRAGRQGLPPTQRLRRRTRPDRPARHLAHACLRPAPAGGHGRADVRGPAARPCGPNGGGEGSSSGRRVRHEDHPLRRGSRSRHRPGTRRPMDHRNPGPPLPSDRQEPRSHP